jgi:hypothetical protein
MNIMRAPIDANRQVMHWRGKRFVRELQRNDGVSQRLQYLKLRVRGL